MRMYFVAFVIGGLLCLAAFILGEYYGRRVTEAKLLPQIERTTTLLEEAVETAKQAVRQADQERNLWRTGRYYDGAGNPIEVPEVDSNGDPIVLTPEQLKTREAWRNLEGMVTVERRVTPQ